jgi:hypothetical protein
MPALASVSAAQAPDGPPPTTCATRVRPGERSEARRRHNTAFSARRHSDGDGSAARGRTSCAAGAHRHAQLAAAQRLGGRRDGHGPRRRGGAHAHGRGLAATGNARRGEASARQRLPPTCACVQTSARQSPGAHLQRVRGADERALLRARAPARQATIQQGSQKSELTT